MLCVVSCHPTFQIQYDPMRLTAEDSTVRAAHKQLSVLHSVQGMHTDGVPCIVMDRVLYWVPEQLLHEAVTPAQPLTPAT